MAEVLDQLSELAKERAASLERASEALGGEAEGLLLLASDSSNFVRFLSVLWTVLQIRLRNGGVPAKRVAQECDMLLGLAARVRHRLSLISKVWPERELPSDIAQPIYLEVQQAQSVLDATEAHILETRNRAATPPRVSADPEQLRQRIKQADEGAGWLKLSDAIAQMRQRGAMHSE